MFFLPICLYFVLNRGEFTMMDNVDLIIHESGHFFFRFFGRFMMFLGGTLMQIITPGILIFYFFVNDYRFGTQVSLFWLGHNLINISVYAADARARRLPLLGGNAVEHDWWTMLGMLDLLAYDQIIGYIFFSLAILVFIILLALPRAMPY